jgi:hypothetical protein
MHALEDRLVPRPHRLNRDSLNRIPNKPCAMLGCPDLSINSEATGAKCPLVLEIDFIIQRALPQWCGQHSFLSLQPLWHFPIGL